MTPPPKPEDSIPSVAAERWCEYCWCKNPHDLCCRATLKDNFDSLKAHNKRLAEALGRVLDILPMRHEENSFITARQRIENEVRALVEEALSKEQGGGK